MKENELKKISDNITDYILLKQFAENEVNVPDALTVLACTTTSIIRSLCSVIGEDAERMITVFCNGMQMTLEKERHYSTGSKEGDETLERLLKELGGGGDVEEIVDKYLDFDSQELRQEAIDSIRGAMEDNRLDNVKIGY